MNRVGLLSACAAFLGAASPAIAAPAYSVIWNFAGGADGANPLGAVLVGANGSLYGSAVNGGHNYTGSVYHLVPPATVGAAWTEETLYSFAGPDGANPYGELVIDQVTGGLLGTTNNGGANNAGIIFRLDPAGGGAVPWTLTDLHDFNAATDGSNPRAGLTHCGGAICGIGTIGGANNLGTVFRMRPFATSGAPYDFRVIWTFAGDDSGSSAPYAPLVMDSAGDLIGTTTGYASGQGAVYKLTPGPSQPHAPWSFSILHSFPFGSDGYHPAAAVKLDASGTAYGTTYDGGVNGGGTVYRLTPPAGGATAWTETVLASFKSDCHAASRLALGSNGALLGTTSGCGAAGLGTVFRLAPKAGDTWKLTILHSFTGGTDGQAPTSGLVRGGNGTYYGTTSGGNSGTAGTAYAITP